jgi:Arc/MetJ-type ribon-helix-helix transcriptional regulator
MAAYPPDIEAFIQKKLASGQFGSREELAAEAIRVYRELEAHHLQLKLDVQAGIDEADRGLCEPLDIEAIKAELIAELDRRGNTN